MVWTQGNHEKGKRMMKNARRRLNSSRGGLGSKIELVSPDFRDEEFAIRCACLKRLAILRSMGGVSKNIIEKKSESKK